MSMGLMSRETILRHRIDMLEKTMYAYDRRMNTQAVAADRKRIQELEDALVDLLPLIDAHAPEKLTFVADLLAKKIWPGI
ncbi:hypothetical protein [Paraburkholderia sp. C35]|uniref:hypothetical protein n=1 Tax=Paraburkholderia sp. C35 TaxID=2126993 RepID=UPI000D687D01|nr:hypothetical protein [Paraburkholderia sp. C35]